MYNNDLFEYLSKLQSSVQGLTAWTNLYQQQMTAVDQIVKSMHPLLEDKGQIQRAVESVTSGMMPALNNLQFSGYEKYMQSALSAQMEALVQAQLVVDTPAISELMGHFQQADWLGGMEQFMRSFSDSFTSAANLAFLCRTEGLEAFMPKNSPAGIRSLMRSIRKRTALRLSETDEIEVNCEEKIFRPRSNVNCIVNVNGMNLIASSTELFSDISETALMELMDILARTPEFATNCEAGQKIWEVIQDWNTFIDFDQEYYYHARAMAKNGCPYTSQEMGQAPAFYVGMGRYNHVGQSHYYFSDREEGARIEVNRHDRNARIQIARLRPRRAIRLLDLSEEITGSNMFLQYIRFDAGDSTAPREYLIPCYVASCCRQAGIDGIKYYGSREYRNYVSWSDGYFDVETTWELKRSL